MIRNWKRQLAVSLVYGFYLPFWMLRHPVLVWRQAVKEWREWRANQ